MADVKEKIMSIFQGPLIGSLATINEDGKPWVRYVMAAAGEDLTICVTTSIHSRKVGQIKANPEVHMTCGFKTIETTSEYLQIQGKAVVSDDAGLKQKLWVEPLKAYFSGPDDPNYVVIVITPYRIEVPSMMSKDHEVWEA